MLLDFDVGVTMYWLGKCVIMFGVDSERLKLFTVAVQYKLSIYQKRVASDC